MGLVSYERQIAPADAKLKLSSSEPHGAELDFSKKERNWRLYGLPRRQLFATEEPQMHDIERSDTLETIHRLKQQIDALAEQQTEALKMATYVGMTPTEAQEYDARRGRITQLIKQLELLQKAQ